MVSITYPRGTGTWFPRLARTWLLATLRLSQLIQLVTFRLADSLSGSRVAEWRHLLKIEDHREKRARLEAYLDRGHGASLAEGTCGAIGGTGAPGHFNRKGDGDRHGVRPNHVHVLVEVWQIPLSSLVRRWKQFVQTQAAAGTDSVNLRWQRDYWDAYMRNEDQELKAIRNTENNPVRPGLCGESKAWPLAPPVFGWYHRLILPDQRRRAGGRRSEGGANGIWNVAAGYPNKSNCGGGSSCWSLARSRCLGAGRTLPSGVSSDSSRLRRITLARSRTALGTPARRATWMP